MNTETVLPAWPTWIAQSSLDPVNATLYLWRGIQYSELGFHNEGIADLEQCLEIDPAYENCRRHLAYTFLILDDNERAMALFQQGYERGFRGSANDVHTAVCIAG